MFPGPCEHCPNPDKALWQSECLYKGHYLTHRAFVRSNFDPPCALDAYDEGQRALARDQNLKALYLTLGVALCLALIFVGIKQL